jgi:hypothetical protein
VSVELDMPDIGRREGVWGMAVSDHDHGGEPSPDLELIATPKDFSHALVLITQAGRPVDQGRGT